ncbi:MAG: DUF3416 domain-containing protein [Phycisphaerae bacterium]|nr:alpha-1,4-glucan--maltose-1-phosphate maltosyltransferase [candidate division KSB1 bacterium]NIU58658.1 DUF3416 domain-containing protein [Phycisphaerae bacterium]NIR71636.1 alpha-1,4-glucan--maltose-1-phosphate maltosyltransferase [candidate division KSB1 bacterium]NIS27976.1 alpha-1,4-glucan--maltose-1-phosphate maltosyltransferase [candidate division KSB1 bacterium]NIT74858.1 alpha-1,4-glucan--maltose-1-phosphate maltosyltransferase [candidate division KSB1 bacterium]
METDGRKRIVIENVKPEINSGRYPIKRVLGEKVTVEADVFGDGHDEVVAVLLYRKDNKRKWHEVPMEFIVNDRWQAEFTMEEIGRYYYTIQGWIEHFQTWRKDLRKKYEAGQDVKLELLIGAEHVDKVAERAPTGPTKKLKSYIETLRNDTDIEAAVSLALDEELASVVSQYPDKSFAYTYEKQLEVLVERKKALFSTWYEIFPRSFSTKPGNHGTFKECERLIPEIAEMGFDIIYFPPIHPIGTTKRKGKNNSPVSEPDDPGSPWAIGSKDGGHKSIHRQLGTVNDFKRFVKRANEHGIEVALDLAYQCSPDHPYVKKHPGWFRWRPDGSVQFAENPPKKYEDVLPIDFETEQWRELWEELKSVVLFWIDKGVHIFRVDNPHTKPFVFWEWLISDIKQDYPDVIFLSEAFTRPKVMYRLAKLGFTQSYTYFTWRNTKQEFTDYLTELTRSDVRNFFRPNFWPNTPDILPEHLQYGGRPAFMTRLVLAATLSSNYGMYAPAFELCINEAVPGKEEYLNSEKYEIKQWDRDKPGNIKDLISKVNKIRKENEALQSTWNLQFYETDNDYFLAYGKVTDDQSNIVIVVVNLDSFHTQSGFVTVPIEELDISEDHPYLVHDLLSDEKYIWQGERNYIELNPEKIPAHVFLVHKRLHREQDFDYFM